MGERGTHQELMRARGGYYGMVLRQMEHAGHTAEALGGLTAR